MVGVKVPFVGAAAADRAPFDVSQTAKALAALWNLAPVHADGAEHPVWGSRRL
jgi:hypothetical protein